MAWALLEKLMCMICIFVSADDVGEGQKASDNTVAGVQQPS